MVTIILFFAHPETLVSSKYGWELLLSRTYQENVIAIVVDKAHCIDEWLVSHFQKGAKVLLTT